MPTLMQKIRLALRGWQRRREEKNQEFLARSLHVPPAPPAAPAVQRSTTGNRIDRDGLTIAYLDTSGRTAYYLDVDTGEVIEGEREDRRRFKRVPVASPEEDRVAFLATIETTAALTAPESFRSALAQDRKLERAWYNFRNDRAIDRIERWLRENGLT